MANSDFAFEENPHKSLGVVHVVTLTNHRLTLKCSENIEHQKVKQRKKEEISFALFFSFLFVVQRDGKQSSASAKRVYACMSPTMATG